MNLLELYAAAGRKAISTRIGEKFAVGHLRQRKYAPSANGEAACEVVRYG